MSSRELLTEVLRLAEGSSQALLLIFPDGLIRPEVVRAVHRALQDIHTLDEATAQVILDRLRASQAFRRRWQDRGQHLDGSLQYLDQLEAIGQGLFDALAALPSCQRDEPRLALLLALTIALPLDVLPD